MFILSAVKSSLAYDEETLYQESEIALELMPNTSSNFSRVKSDYLSIIVGTASIILFLALVYFAMLPDHVKNRVFGLYENQKAR